MILTDDVKQSIIEVIEKHLILIDGKMLEPMSEGWASVLQMEIRFSNTLVNGRIEPGHLEVGAKKNVITIIVKNYDA